MNDKSNKIKLIMIFLAVVSVLILVYFMFFTKDPNLCPRLIPSYVLLIYLILLVLVIVPLTYLFISKALEVRFDQNLKILSKLMNKEDKSDKDNNIIDEKSIILKFLNTNEKKVLNTLIENKGMILQSHLSHIEGMDKLKTHRTVKDLLKKGIVSVESYGKTNKIFLTDSIKNILK